MPATIELPINYSKLDVFLAAVAVQIHLYNEHGENNSNNARIFEAPAIVHKTLTESLHSDENVAAYERFFASVPASPEWEAIQSQHPFQIVDDKINALPDKLTRQQFANYFLAVAEFFKQRWPTIEAKIKEQKPDITITKKLQLSLLKALSTAFTPKVPGGIMEEKIQKENCVFNLFLNKIFSEEFIEEADDYIESIYKSVLKSATTIVTAPINSEKPYNGLIKTTPLVGNEIDNIFMEDPENLEKFKLLDTYTLPEYFLILTKREAFFPHYLEEKNKFLFLVKKDECHPELYKESVTRFHNAILEDTRCPKWIQQKTYEYSRMPKDLLVKYGTLVKLASQPETEPLNTYIKNTLQIDTNPQDSSWPLLAIGSIDTKDSNKVYYMDAIYEGTLKKSICKFSPGAGSTSSADSRSSSPESPKKNSWAFFRKLSSLPLSSKSAAPTHDY